MSRFTEWAEQRHSKEEESNVFDFFLGSLILVTGFIFVFDPLNAFPNKNAEDLKKQAIERGFAHHDSLTGEWQWNEPAEVSGE